MQSDITDILMFRLCLIISYLRAPENTRAAFFEAEYKGDP